MMRTLAVVAGLLSLACLGMTQSIVPVDVTTMATFVPGTSTTSSPSPSPTSSPTPVPLAVTNFLLMNKDDDVCAHVQTTLELDISYANDTGAKNNVWRSIMVTDMHPEVDQDTSVCGNLDILMDISFYNSSQYIHYLTFEFSREKSDSKDYKLERITVNLDLNDSVTFPNLNTSALGTDLTANTTDNVFQVEEKKSYKCKSRRSWKMATNPDLGKNGLTVKVSKFRAQAFDFKNSTTGNFDSGVTCSRDQKSSKVVPIAVGAALAGLVVVVLIAYLIGRFRSRKQNSYEALS